MGADRFTLRTWFMILMGAGITILLIMSSTALWKHNFRETILFLSVAASLTFIFYRGRLALLAAMGCAWIVVNAGLTAVFHPSVVGISLTVASVIGLVFFCRLVGRQHPNLLPDDWQKVFDRK
jgi:hypothetical protein